MGNSCTGKAKGKDGILEPEEHLPLMKRSEVAKHNTPEDCWIIIDNIVYNVSQYWKVHPGGGDYVKRWAGKDATLAYREFNHSAFADVQLRTLGAEVGVVNDQMETFNSKYYEETVLPKATTDIENFNQTGDMMCYQCQQSMNGTGCTDMGVCGKNPTIAALQDLIVHYLKGIAQYLTKLDPKHWDEEIKDQFLYGFFMTLTNVNFNLEKHFSYIKKLSELRDKFKAIYEKETPADKRDAFLTSPNSPSAFVYKDEEKYLFEEARNVGIMARKVQTNPDFLGLIEMCVYGLKGGCAYMYHSEGIRNSIKDKDVYGEGPRTEVFKELFAITAGLTDPNPTLEGLLGLNMGVGKSNFTVMDFLDKGHNLAFGKPTPSPVNRAPVEGKCILVSGHDMVVLKNLLDQTKDKGVNIYTHGEMLPAFGYPELKKYDHLVGNFGGAWFNQTNEFPDFPGAILLNSNCLIQPQPSYAKRLFTTHIVGWDDIKHIEGNDYSELIECALKQPGFKKGTRQFKKYENVESEMTGYGHATMAEMLVPEIKAGNLTEIYLVGGCDNLDPTRQKYLEVMLNLPPTAIVLTLGCAKFRLFGHKEQMGYLPGGNKVPRLIDVGQCNDSYSAVKVALALTEILGVGVNELPLHLVLSWVEQKAVVILLTLLHLGIKNINIGPNLPVFLTPTLVNYLVQNFALQPMSMPKQIKSLLKFQSRQQEERPMEMFANLQDFVPCKFAAKKEIAINTFQMTFEFMNKESVYSLKPGQHIIFRAKNNEGDFVSRAYTPISSPGSKGSFDIIVKVYQEGLFSNFLKNMESGDLIEVQGPCGSTLYEEKQGKICLKSDLQQFSDVKSINMVSGGTSCVSMYQIIQEIVEKKQTNIKANVIVANSKANLKVLEKEFMALKEKDSAISKNINIVYICSDKEGRISKQLFEKHFVPAASDKNVVNLVAGPVNFRQAACSIFQELNYPESNLVKFY